MTPTLFLLLCFVKCVVRSQTVLEGGFLSMLRRGTSETEDILIKLDRHIPKSKLDANIFQNIPNVRNITIEYAFNSISPQAVSELKRVRYINLNGNTFSELPGRSFAETSAEELHLYNCGIGVVKPEAFHNANIRVLNMRHNRIKVLQDGVFNNLKLQELDLSENNLEFIQNHALADMSALSKLILNHNQLSQFQSNILMSPSYTQSRLRYLDLSNNALSFVTEHSFVILHELESLHLESNNISKIYPSTFESNKNLKHLYLGNNKLNSVDGSVLPYRQLQTLYVQNNKLTGISAEVLDRLNGLGQIAVYRNFWKCRNYQQLKNWIKVNGVDEVNGYEINGVVCKY